MSKTHVTSEFDSLLDGRLSDAASRRIHTHMDSCQQCRDAWELHVAVWEELKRVTPVMASTGFTERTMRNLDREDADVLVPRRTWLPVLRWAWAPVAAAAALVVAIVMLNQPQKAPTIANAAEEQQRTLQVAENYELLQDFELIAVLDQLADSNSGVNQ